MKRRDWLLLAIAAVLIILPLLLPMMKPQEQPFTGTDEQAQAAINASHPDYKPWFRPVWEPPDSAIESLLFTLQAALGAGVLGYYIGFKRGQARRTQQSRHDAGD